MREGWRNRREESEGFIKTQTTRGRQRERRKVYDCEFVLVKERKGQRVYETVYSCVCPEGREVFDKRLLLWKWPF